MPARPAGRRRGRDRPRRGFDPSSIASLGSAIALLVFTLVTAAHFRVRGETGASTLVLSVAIASTVIVLLTLR